MAGALVKITTSEGHEFKITKEVANMSETIKNLLEAVGDSDEAVNLTNVTKEVFTKVVAFCEHHVADAPMSEEDRKEWKTKEFEGFDAEFVKLATNAEQVKDLFDLTLAANFLDIKLLLDCCCKSIAFFIKANTPDTIKTMFGIEGDFTKEEEDAVKAEHDWLKGITLLKGSA